MRIEGQEVRPEAYRRAVRAIAAAMPDRYRAQRRGLMFEEGYQTLSIKESACPVCREDPGWLDFERLEPCPVCCGFQMVPDSIVQWFSDQIRSRFGDRPVTGRTSYRSGASYLTRRDVVHKVHMPAAG